MKFDVNKNKVFLIALGALLVLALVAVILWRGAAGGARTAAGELSGASEQYQALVRKYKGAPGQELVAQYQQKLATVKQQANAMRTAVPESPLPSFTPASFKDELRTLRDKFQALSAATGILIPEDIGFGPYIGTEMPRQAEMPRLTSQLVLVSDVLAILFTNRVISVTTIDRNPQGAAMAAEEVYVDGEEEVFSAGGPAARLGKTPEESAQKARAIFEAVPVMFQFRITPGQLYPILAAVRNTHHFYRVSRVKSTLDVQAMGEIKDPADIDEELSVDLVVEHIVLRDEAQPEATK